MLFTYLMTNNYVYIYNVQICFIVLSLLLFYFTIQIVGDLTRYLMQNLCSLYLYNSINFVTVIYHLFDHYDMYYITCLYNLSPK